MQSVIEQCLLCRFSVAKRWQLVMLWPFLLAMNGKFRAEFLSSLRGGPPSDADHPRLQSKDDKGS